MRVAFKGVNRGPVPATVPDKDVPRGLDYIISRAIAKDPSQRYQRGMEMALDIQALQEGREPWSKAQQPDSGGSALQSANESGRLSTLLPLAMAANRASNRRALTEPHSAAERLLAMMRRKSFASAFLAVGLFLFGLRLGHLAWRQEGLPPATAKTVGPPPVVTEIARASANSTPLVKKPRMRLPASESHAADAQAVPSASPIAPAMLEIEVDHKFADARISIWLGCLFPYTPPLERKRKKHLVVFHTC